MDFDNVKAEKAKALRRYNRFRRIGRFFRASEFCVAILFISWTFTRLPFALRISREFLRRIACVISTPLFVFLLGNCIVLLLLTKSSDQSSAADTEIYQAFVRSLEDRSNKPSDEDLTEEIVYDDKHVILTDSKSNPNPNPNLVAGENIPQDHVEICVSDQPKVYRRSKSAKQSPGDMLMKPSLRRSETTEKCRKIMKEDYPEDNLSNEEFQKTIEAFIAKQLMFRRQESLAVVLVHNKP